MTSLLDRAAAWLVAPRDDPGPDPPVRRAAPRDDPGPDPLARQPARFAPPVARRAPGQDAVRRATLEDDCSRELAAPHRGAVLDALESPPVRRARGETPVAAPAKRRRARRPVAAAADGRRIEAATAARPAVLGPESEVLPVAAGLALALRGQCRAAAGTVLLWRPLSGPARGQGAPAATLATSGLPAPARGTPGLPAPARGTPGLLAPALGTPGLPAPALATPGLHAATLATPGLPGARLLAARLARRGLAAVAHGRLAWVLLPPAAIEAAAGIRRVEAAAGNAPSVLAVLGARDAAVDALLADRDLAVLAAEPGSAIADLAEADLAALGMTVHACSAPSGGPARFALLAGLRAPSSQSDAPLAGLVDA